MPTFQNMGAYLLVEATEPYAQPLWLATIRQVAERCQQEDLHKALIDIRQASGSPSILQRYEIGLEIANVWGRRIHAAAIGRPETTDYMAETVARNRGADLRVFLDLEQALEWLDLETPGTGSNGNI